MCDAVALHHEERPRVDVQEIREHFGLDEAGAAAGLTVRAEPDVPVAPVVREAGAEGDVEREQDGYFVVAPHGDGDTVSGDGECADEGSTLSRRAQAVGHLYAR